MVKLKLAITGAILINSKAKPDFDKDLKFGEKYENDFQKAVEGKVECKTDRRCKDTGNVYIEIESRGKPSGIYTTKSRNYAICLWVEKRKDQIWVLIPVKILKKLVKSYPIKWGGDYNSSKGHIVPKQDLLNLII